MTIANVQIGVSAWVWSKKKSTFELFIIEPNNKVVFVIENFFKGFWKFQYNKENYEFHRHKGHKKSLHNSSGQVALYDKRNINVGVSDKVTLLANNNENPIVLFALFISYDFGDTEDSEVTIDFGNISNGLKEFDENWRPKD